MIKLDKGARKWLRKFTRAFGCLESSKDMLVPVETIFIFSSLTLRYLRYRPETRNVPGTFNTETVIVCEAKFTLINLKKRIRRQLQLLSEFFPVEVRYLILEAYIALL